MHNAVLKPAYAGAVILAALVAIAALPGLRTWLRGALVGILAVGYLLVLLFGPIYAGVAAADRYRSNRVGWAVGLGWFALAAFIYNNAHAIIRFASQRLPED